MESNNPTTTSPQPGDQAHAKPHRFHIQNGLIYWGIVVLMASLLLWLGVELAKRIGWFLPYSGGLGLSLIAGGYLLELRKARKARASQRSQPGATEIGSAMVSQASASPDISLAQTPREGTRPTGAVVRACRPRALGPRSVVLGMIYGSVLPALISLSASAQAVPPEAIEQLQQVVGNRVEAVSILGGNYAAAGGLYTFRGGNLADLSISKIGGGGEVASTRPLGLGSLEWAPVLLGNVGMVSARNEFKTGFLAGNEMTYDTLALAAGGGVAIYFTEHLSLSPTVSGMYGRVENKFNPQNANGNLVATAGNGTLVNWILDTWSVVPGLELDYEWNWGRTTFEFSSAYTFFHTESFESSSPILGVKGNSTTWENKLEADVPLGLKVFGRELHTGGFFSRTEVFGDAAHGLNTDYAYTVNGRLVLDFLGKLWKLKWLGVGASYFWGHDVQGWSAGLDMRFKF